MVANCLSLEMLLKSFNPVERYLRKVQRGFKGLLEAVGALEEFHSCTETFSVIHFELFRGVFLEDFSELQVLLGGSLRILVPFRAGWRSTRALGAAQVLQEWPELLPSRA